MRVLVACEESQAVTIAFRNKGHEAYSCDIQDCSGGHPEWHIKGDVFDAINGGQWDMMIGHPPCTYLSYAGIRWFNIDKYGEKAILRHKLKDEAIKFFKKMYNCGIPKICLENPRGFIMKELPPTQLIHPYYFGDECTKATHLWLKGLPPLQHSAHITLFDDKKTHVYKGAMCQSGSKQLFGLHTLSLSKEDRSKLRSKTFQGIANAMANQWGNI